MKGHEEAAEGGELLNDAGFKFDLAYTSYLKRAIRTCGHVLEATDCLWIPVVKAWELNERHYGGLTGLDISYALTPFSLSSAAPQPTLLSCLTEYPPPFISAGV